MDELWQVYAIKYADRNARTRNDSFILDANHDTQHDMDYFIWVLKSPLGTILVDTGYDQAEGALRNRPVHRDPGKAVEALGIDPASIDTVIITHMHYDHAGGLDQFPNAVFHIQEAEMSYVTGPCMCHPHIRYPFSADHVCQMVQRLFTGRVHFHDGESQVAPGVTVHKIGGHTQGLQVVRVKTQSGWMCLASDAAHYYENFEAGKPFPIVLSLHEMLDGFKTIQSLASDPGLVIPGHDPLVLKHFDQTDGLPDYVRRLDLGPNSSFPSSNSRT